MDSNTFYEFFAGGGMARAGLGMHWQCLFANDFDPKKASAYASNWTDRVLHVGDVGNLVPEQLPGIADLIWASFPCQDLSLAGSGAGLSGRRSGAFWPFWELLSELIAKGRKPKAIVLENVCGLITSRGGKDFEILCETVGASGYWVGAVVADAKDFLPHSRPRLFIIAFDIERKVPGFIQNDFAVDHWHPDRLRKAQALMSRANRSRWLWFTPPVPPKSDTKLGDIIEQYPSDVEWHTISETERLLNMMSPINRAKVDMAVKSQTKAYGAIYKRTRHEGGKRVQRAEIRFDCAGCLRTPGGGSSRQFLLHAEKREVRTRLLSARETARLMGLEDSYKLPSRYNDAYHLTGDGVAVPVVKHLAEHIIEPFLAMNQESRAVA